MNGRLTALLQWQNIDLGMKEINRQRITTSGADFYPTTSYIYETDVLMLNLRLNLNKLTRKLKLPGSEFGEKEFNFLTMIEPKGDSLPLNIYQ